MRDETEILDDLQGFYAELSTFPPEAHWFCPKQDNDDGTDYENLDQDCEENGISLEIRKKRLEAAKGRHDVAYKCSLIFGLGSDGMGSMKEDYRQRLNNCLTNCDRCIHNWHLGRKAYLKELSEQFDDETVKEMSNRLDMEDFRRIELGLIEGADRLRAVDPAKHTRSLLLKGGQLPLLALYEALCCPAYHTNDEKLATNFDYVFESVQRKKPLKLGDILPSMATFFFSKNPIRRKFADSAWSPQEEPLQLTPQIFEWAVHDALTKEIQRVAPPTTELEDINLFWQAFLPMLHKMDQRLITHSLRAMEVQPDIYYLALQHLWCNSDNVVRLVLRAIQALLEKSPKDFWAALGTVSSTKLAELIFGSPGYSSILSSLDTFEDPKDALATSWIPHYLNSLIPIHQTDACRMLLSHLLGRLQDNKYSLQARVTCCRAGLDALYTALQTFTSSDYTINPSTSLIAISNILELVEKYMKTIISCADQPKPDPSSLDQSGAKLRELGMLVIREALALDCKAISAEFDAFNENIIVQRGVRDKSQLIWQAVLDIFHPGNLELAHSILPATSPLLGLDELRPPSKKEELKKEHAKFNEDLLELWGNVARIFERLSDFSETHLKELCRAPQTARPLFAALVSANEGICNATVEIIKAATNQPSKQEALETILEIAFLPALNSLTIAFSHISKAKTFGPVPSLIKIGRDVIHALCGSTGVLRSRSSFDQKEKNVIMGWWSSQWRTLDVVFDHTEGWALRVKKQTAEMQNFCRDSMEYAESLFDQYSVFASALRERSPSPSNSITETASSSRPSIQRVLGVVSRNVSGLVVMLRLRDPYLISVITSLLGKLLRCLGDYEVEVEEMAANFIKDACKRENAPGFRRTNLTNQQKAELQRTLDEHQGVPQFIGESKTIMAKKQGTIDAWSKSADGKMYEPKLPTSGTPSTSTPGLDKHKETLGRFRAQQHAQQVVSAQSKQNLIQSRKKAEEDRKRRDAEAIAKARALRAPSGLVKGEGSGLAHLGGIAGKDHAPARNEIMVGSSDEDSDSDEEVGETNALLKRQSESSKRVSEYEASRRRAMMQLPQGPVRKTKIQRSAKDLRARVEPNMDLLYLEILNWDIFHNSDEPPTHNPCRRIDNKYLDLDLYERTFGPLLIAEVWRSLVTAKEENNSKPIEIKVLNRLSVDKFMEVSSTMPMTTNRDLKMSERDIVLLSRSSDPMNDPSEPHCLARVDRTNRKKDMIEVTFRISREISPQLLACFFPNSKVFAVKIADMTTTQREYAALRSLRYYDLCTEVLEAKPSPLMKYGEEKITSIAAKYTLNRGQATAILSANDNDGFTLIQGPPGSGKTKTIVAMVGSLLTQTLQQQQADQAKVRPPMQGQKALPQPLGPKKKLLICAPSNAAVDELVLRLKDGVQPLQGPRQKINVIRLGRSDAINDSVKDVMLDELVRQKLEGDNGEKNKLLQDRDNLHKNAAVIKERLNVLRPLMEAARGKSEEELMLRQYQREFDDLKRKQARIGAKIDEDKESGNTVSRQNEINRRRFQQEILDGAHVICATLSGSGHDMFKNLTIEFETVIIDEAAQCIELSALIPLKYGCNKCILVGDPEQLPPTVLSRFAQSFGYEQSLFVRMQKNYPKDVHLLDTQYRMHPEISRFPSQQFYNGRLLDGDGMAALRQQPWHQSSVLGPYRFFDVRGIQTKQAHGHSFINVPELNAAIALYQRLKADFRDIDFKGKIGIITTYKAQLLEMKSRFANRFGDAIFEEIEFNTTDAFQGREREIIIFSCVRASQGGIGFLGDIRRMNVGLTRAKSSLWVLGDSRSLQQGEYWNRLIEDSKSRDRYTTGDVMSLLSKPTSHDWKPEKALVVKQPVQSSGAIKAESNDVEMIDAPSRSTSGNSTPSSAMVASKTAIKQESRKPSLTTGGMATMDGRRPSLNSTSMTTTATTAKKRSRGSVDEGIPSKKVHATKTETVSALELALRDQEARNAATPAPPPRPVRPPGVLPRRPAPADPFIKRKPAKRS